MTIFEVTALLMVLTVSFSFLNYRVLRMPTTIGVTFVALAASLGIVVHVLKQAGHTGQLAAAVRRRQQQMTHAAA